jgi:endonuclease/exonuclease/phosphatase family metal-dependent hydrolase
VSLRRTFLLHARAGLLLASFFGAAACRLEGLPSDGAGGAEAGGSDQGGSDATTTGAGGTDGTGGQASATEVIVGTWNLEHFPLSPKTLTTVSGALAQMLPQVLGVQEIDDVDVFDELAASLPEYQALVASEGDGYSRVGLLVDTARVGIGNVDTLFTDDYWAFPRPPLRAHLAVDLDDGTTFDFDVIVVHLKASLDEESASRRRLACERLADWIRGQQQGGEEQDFIVLGDWNDELLDPQQWNVFPELLGDPETFRFLTQPLERAGEATFIPFSSFLDHIMVTTDALDEYGAGATEVLHLDASIPNYRDDVSDHRPVLARFRPPAGAAR